jgi:hypothetical protein
MLPAYCNLNLPAPPDNIIDLAKSIANDCLNNKAISTFSQTHPGAYLEMYNTATEIEEWVKHNISPDHAHHTGMQVIKNYDLLPHVDPAVDPPHYKIRRHYTLIYLLDTGGEPNQHPVTDFYKLKNKNFSDKTIIPGISDLNKIHSVQFEPNAWNLLSNQIIHSVTGVTKPRISLAVSFFDKTFPEFLKEHLNQ